MLDFTFPKRCDWLKGGWVGRKGGYNKKGKWNIFKSSEGVLINGNRANGLQFFLRIGITPIPCN